MSHWIVSYKSDSSKPLYVCFLLLFTFSFIFLQTSLITKELTKHENKFKSFMIEKLLKIDFQNFHISWKASKSISWTFLSSLHNETILPLENVTCWDGKVCLLRQETYLFSRFSSSVLNERHFRRCVLNVRSLL